MGNALEKLQRELAAAQQALAEAEARCARHDAEHQAVTRELKEARERIEQSHREWIAALDVMEDPIFLHDKDCRILRCNRAYQKCAGIPFKQIIGRLYYEVFPKTHPQAHHCGEVISGKIESGEDEMMVGETIYRSRSFSISDEHGNYLYSMHTLEDVTDRKQAEERLQESEERLNAIVEGALDGIALADVEKRRLSSVNPAMCRMLGYSAEELKQLSIEDIHPQQDWPYVLEQFEKQARGEIQISPDIPVKRKDGSVFYADINSTSVNFSGKNYILGIFRDITERKQHEIDIRKANRALSLLSECNTLLVHATDEQEMLTDICKLAVETGGYLMAWVGFAGHDKNKTVRPVALSGYEEGYLDNASITWANTEHGRGPTGTAIRMARTVVNQDVLTNPDMVPWREAALKRGYQSSIALPLVSGEQVLGALTIYALEPNAFSEEEVPLLEELANDLTYGIITLRTRKEHEQHNIVLRQSLEQSIQTIADTVEARDPYTAGHQRRVAELARAIAQEMDLPADQVNGLHLAAIIHDLGKIHIPAEILSKPGKLSPIEFELIKTHPQEGYNILKNVKFPWPIAEIILQHHERLDGSGYPQGLKGEQILLEARIMAVADVVEAISSHRPYRPGFGIEAALEEIENNRNVRYDPKVADACLRLFRERGYELPG